MLGTIIPYCAGARQYRAVQHITAAVSATAPPAELAVSSADAVFPLYKRLQNGSDIRGIAVDGKPSCGLLC